MFFKSVWIVIVNFVLIRKYPFIAIKDHRGKINYRFSWYYTIPDGWRKSFGIDMLNDVSYWLKNNKIQYEYEIYDIKEKYGVLCVYDNSPHGLFDVIQKYVNDSYRTCIFCGDKATHRSVGWIAPYCDECMNEQLKKCPDMRFEQIRDEDEDVEQTIVL